MRTQLFSIACLLTNCFLATACHTTTPQIAHPNTNPELTTAAAQQINAYKHTEIEFKKNSTELDTAMKTELKKLFQTVDKTAKLDEVIILTWADREYPSAEQETLTDEEIQLADQRAKAVTKYIRSMRSVDVDTHNMAERPTIFGQWANSQDYRLKKSLTAAGLPTTEDSLSFPYKASRTIVFAVVQ